MWTESSFVKNRKFTDVIDVLLTHTAGLAPLSPPLSLSLVLCITIIKESRDAYY